MQLAMQDGSRCHTLLHVVGIQASSCRACCCSLKLIYNCFHLQVVASTAVLIILMSSSTIALSYFFRGDLPLHYAAVLAPACFLSSLLGVILVGRYGEAIDRQWHVCCLAPS